MKAFALVLLCAAGCAAADTKPTAVTKIDASHPSCRGMEAFKAKHVDAFFAKAKEVTSHQAEGYSVLPCAIQGRTVLGGEPVTFVLHPFGVADVTDKAGKTTLYACDDCSDLFPPH